MFLGDFFKVARPVGGESVLFRPVLIVLLHRALDALLEARLVYGIELVPGLDYRLMVVCVHHLDLGDYLVGLLLGGRGRLVFFCVAFSVLWEELTIVNLEWWRSESWPFPRLALGEVG